MAFPHAGPQWPFNGMAIGWDPHGLPIEHHWGHPHELPIEAFHGIPPHAKPQWPFHGMAIGWAPHELPIEAAHGIPICWAPMAIQWNGHWVGSP